MKKQFQSKSVPRGTRTIWRYLGALFLLFTFAIGQMWGADAEIIKVTLAGTSGADRTVTGTIGGTSAVANLASSSPYKLNSDGAYVSLTLSTGYFESTDIVTITGADKAHQIYYGTPTSGTLLCTTPNQVSGTITVKLKGLPANQNTIYVYRASSTYNGKLTTMAVTRPDLSPTGTAVVSYTMTKGSANVEGDVSNVNTVDATSTAFAVSTLAIGSNNSKDGYCGQITGHAAAYSATQYVQLGFTVASGYTFTPSATSIINFANSTSDMKAKVVISDGTTSIESNELSCSSNADSQIEFASGAFTGKALSGNVTITIYQWGVTSKRAYIKSPLTITGTVASAAPATKHSVEYDLNGGTGTTPTQADVAEGAKFTLHDGTTGITAPSGQQFAGWNDGTTTYAGGAEYTMGTDDVELTAVWETAKTNPTATFSNGAYVVGASALDLSGLWSSNSDGAVTYALKEASDDASVTAGAFSATKAGSYVVTASQAATSTYNAIEKEATITVTWPATGAATITYALSGTTTTGTVSGVSSISGLSSSLTLSTLTLSGTKDGYSGAIKGTSQVSELEENTYADVYFTVANGYVFTPSAVTVQANPLGNTGALKAVVKVMDAQPLEVASNELACAKNTDNAVTFASGAFTNKKFEGTVHLRMYFYGPANDKAFYIKSPISITGTVAVAPTKYNVNFDKNDEGAGGSQTTLKYEAGAEVTLPACTFDAPTGKEFDAWTSTDVTITDGKFTMPSNAVTIKATWKTSSTKYTVTYKEGETTLDTEDVVAGTAPTGYSALESKNLASFVAWYNNADLAEEHKIADMTAVEVSKDTTFYGKWNYQYAASANIEQWVLTNGTSYDAVAQLGTLHYASNIANSLDSLNDDPSKDNRNYAYLGLKIKAGGKMLDFRLANGQTVKVKFGATGNYPQVALNGGSYAAMSLTDNVWTYTAEGADAFISIKTANNNTVVIKQVMINEDIAAVTLPWRVTYDANGGTCATAEAIWSGEALILPNVTPAVPADYTFAGWYDEVSGGELQGVAGASYTPTDNETLFAHFAPVEYAIAYDGNGATSGSMTAGAAGWGTLVTPDANAFVKSGNVFSGWVITKTSDGSATGITFSEGKFEMPKYDVTLVAQWDDVSKVAVIVETNVKYESLADAVAAATDGQTIQLLQNNNVTAQVEVAGKAITLDLAGYKIEYTGTSTLPSGVILVHNGASLTIDDSSDPDAGSIVSGADAYAAIALTKAGDDAANPAVLEINGGTFTGDYYAITGNGSRHNTQIIINAGTFSGAHANDNSAIYHPQQGTLIINGGTFTGYSAAIELRAGTLEINDGTFTATATEYSCNPSGSGTTTVGAAIAIAQHNTQKDIAVTINGGTFEGVKAINEANPQGNPAPAVAMSVTDGDFTGEVSTVDVHEFISGGTYDAPVTNENCAYGYVPAPEVAPGVYTVMPKDGVEIIGVVVTGNTTGDVSGLYKGTATVNLNSKKIDSGKYIYVTLKEGYTFEENDVLIVDVMTKSNIGTKALEITTGVGNIDGAVWKSIAVDDYATGDNIISLEGIADGQTSIGLKRSDNQNSYINGIRVLRPMKPMLTAITIDGRDGVIDEVNKTVAVNIPFEADLDNLTIVDEVLWNEAAATDAKVVTTNSGAWVEAPATNTYRLTDKDGDYTDYIITLTRDVLKHTVSFNVHGGSAVASELVEDGGYLAAAPADPTKEDYIFQYWSEDEDGAEVDVTTVQINADKEFHAVWASDGAIKLLDGEGNINTTNFITGVTATTVTINEVEHKAAAWGGTQGAISGTNQLGKIVQYNATTNRTKIKVSVYNTNSSPKQVYLHKILEGETTAVVETLAVASKGNAPVESEYYEFNSDANRSFYLTTNSTDVKIVQVKVIESGDVTLKRAGEAGYELNLNKGRVLAYANTDINFEGLAFTASSNYGVISSSELQIKAPLSFTISSPVTLTLNNNSNKYQVSQSISGSGDEYAAGEQVLDLTTTGTWYIVPTTTSAVKLTSIAFALPKCEKPTIADLADVELCAGEPYTELTVSATKSDEGTLHYAWFKEAGETDEAVGTDAATYTPAADGEYYVIVTNTLAGHQDNAATSNTISVAHFASVAITTAPEDVYKHTGLEATLSVVATGKNLTYKWFTCDDELGTNPVAIVPAETAADLNLTAIESGIKYYQVVVTDECGTSESAVAKVEGFDDLPLQDVTGNMTWDFSKDGLADQAAVGTDVVMVNVAGVVNNDDFHSDNIMVTANKQAGTKLQASMIKFHTTVDGMIKVVFSNTGNKTSDRYLTVNGRKTDKGSKNQTAVIYTGFVYAGDVVLGVVEGDGNMLNFTSVEFKATVDYPRTVNPSFLGTLCWTNNAVLGGATLYEFAGKNEYNYLVFDEVPENRLEAGKPYIFMPENGNTEIKVYNTDNEDALTEADLEPVNNMYGTVEGKTLVPGQDDNMYYFSSNHIWAVKDFAVNISVPAYYCYVDYAAVLAAEPAPAPAPGRRRVTMGVNGKGTATGIDAINASEKPMKLIIDGQMFILRGQKMFDATGRLVK